MAVRILIVTFVVAVLAGCSQRQKNAPTEFAPRQSIPAPAPADDPLLGSSNGRPSR